MSPNSDAARPCDSIDDVLMTSELAQRLRAPDYEAENKALSALAAELASGPHRVLQNLADLVLPLRSADSAGVSVLEVEGECEVFRWHAAAGAFAPYLNGTIATSR